MFNAYAIIMTRQMAKELMLKGLKVTHTTFTENQYACMNPNLILETGQPFNNFYNNDVYKVGWEEYAPQSTTPDIAREFVIQMFEHRDYAGWRNIAEKLYDNGVCIVAGEKSIWMFYNYGAGAYVRTKENDSYIGCLEYTFDKEKFLNSAYFKEQQEKKFNGLRRAIELHQNKIEELENEILSIEKLNKNV